ncbi:MAG: peptidase M61 [Sphingobacteriaceae bacterium]|nr:peptidase M61 [Sphingobacteriaceae bacterium]
MKQVSVFTLALVWLCYFGSAAQAPLQYTISFPKPSSHYVEVALQLAADAQDTVEFRLPVWTPGSYLIREFSRNLDGMRASSNGAPLAVQQFEKNAWRVVKAPGAALEVRYRVYSKEFSVRTSFVNEEQAALVGTTYLLFVPQYLQARHELNIQPYPKWKNVATALPQTGKSIWQRYANNYDELVDAPIEIGNFKSFYFEAAGVQHQVAMPGLDKFPEKDLKRDMAKIVVAATDIFDHQPNQNYLFIVQHSLQGGGGLEHSASTTLQTRKTAYDTPKSYQGFMGLVAHEYFHLWNVKRLRPVALGPFDYNRENYTHNLWFSEGFTSYYDNLLLARTHLMAESDYLNVLSSGFEAVLGNKGDEVQSVAQSSLEAWIKFYLRNENSGNISVSYYRKGAMLGFVFDAALLQASKGAFGLDSVMKRMYHRYALALDRGFTDAELFAEFKQHLGAEADSIFANYIYGTRPIDFARYAAYAGLVLEDTAARQPMAYFGASWRKQGERQFVTALREGSAAWEMGLQTDDELLKLNGKEEKSFDAWMKQQQPGTKVKLKVWRLGEELTLEGKLDAYPAPRFYLYKQPDATAQQRLIYEKLVGYPF